jgi:hypothetical protein
MTSTKIRTVKNSSKNKLLIVSNPGKLVDPKEIPDVQLTRVNKAIRKKSGTSATAIIFFLRMKR